MTAKTCRVRWRPHHQRRCQCLSPPCAGLIRPDVLDRRGPPQAASQGSSPTVCATHDVRVPSSPWPTRLRKLLAEGSACGRVWGLSTLVNLSARMHAGRLARPCQPAAVRRHSMSGRASAVSVS